MAKEKRGRPKSRPTKIISFRYYTDEILKARRKDKKLKGMNKEVQAIIQKYADL